MNLNLSFERMSLITLIQGKKQTSSLSEAVADTLWQLSVVIESTVRLVGF